MRPVLGFPMTKKPLRYLVSGALLVGSLSACGANEHPVNEAPPEPEPVMNEAEPEPNEHADHEHEAQPEPEPETNVLEDPEEVEEPEVSVNEMPAPAS